MMCAPKIRIIVKHLLGTRVLAYNNRPGATEVLAALRAGALGYVSEASPHPVLLVAIMTVAQCKRFVDPHLMDPMFQNILADLSPGPPTVLTAREQDVLRRIAWGFFNRDTAIELGLRTNTVESYRAKACEKLGLLDRPGNSQVRIDVWPAG